MLWPIWLLLCVTHKNLFERGVGKSGFTATGTHTAQLKSSGTQGLCNERSVK